MLRRCALPEGSWGSLLTDRERAPGRPEDPPLRDHVEGVPCVREVDRDPWDGDGFRPQSRALAASRGWRESMWAKVIYESMFGNDQQVAPAIAVGLKAAGVTPEAVDVGVAKTTIGPERHAPGTWSRAVLAGVSHGCSWPPWSPWSGGSGLVAHRPRSRGWQRRAQVGGDRGLRGTGIAHRVRVAPRSAGPGDRTRCPVGHRMSRSHRTGRRAGPVGSKPHLRSPDAGGRDRRPQPPRPPYRDGQGPSLVSDEART